MTGRAAGHAERVALQCSLLPGTVHLASRSLYRAKECEETVPARAHHCHTKPPHARETHGNSKTISSDFCSTKTYRGIVIRSGRELPDPSSAAALELSRSNSEPLLKSQHTAAQLSQALTAECTCYLVKKEEAVGKGGLVTRSTQRASWACLSAGVVRSSYPNKGRKWTGGGESECVRSWWRSAQCWSQPAVGGYLLRPVRRPYRNTSRLREPLLAAAPARRGGFSNLEVPLGVTVWAIMLKIDLW